MKSETFYTIDSGGGLHQVEQVVRAVELTDQFMTAMSKNVPRVATNAISMAHLTGVAGLPGMANITLAPGNRVVNMPLNSIPLTTVYLLDGEVLYPAFDSEGPTMPMIWVPPTTMRVILSVVLGDANQETCQFLTAFDPQGRCWRLPLSNLYEDCKLCPGTNSDSQVNASMIHGAQRVWQQFQRSIWQKDLYTSQGDSIRKATRNLFRFIAKDKGFIQQPPVGDWEASCKKIGVDFITQNIRP
jgi:RES domain-containing protein